MNNIEQTVMKRSGVCVCASDCEREWEKNNLRENLTDKKKIKWEKLFNK